MAHLRILLADDHTLVRQGLRKIIEEHEDWEVVAEASDGREAVAKAIALRPDVALLDVGMASLNGIEAARQIVRRNKTTRVLMLSMYLNEAYITRALKAGASGYILKDSVDEDLRGAISVVAVGTSFFSPPVAKIILDHYVRTCADTEGAGDRYDTLSPREREIFQLIVEGRGNKDIAALLSLSVMTIETHRSHIFHKLDVHNAAELVMFAARRGLVADAADLVPASQRRAADPEDRAVRH